MNREILTLRGSLFQGRLDNYDPNDPNSDPSIISNAMKPMGLISKFTITPNVEQTKIQEWQTGLDGTAESWSRVLGGKLSMLADESSPGNLALNFFGKVNLVRPGSVTAAKIAVKDSTTKKYSELDDTTPLKANVGYYFVQEIAGDGLSYTPYTLIDVSSFVLTDSSGTPKTLTVGTDYTIDGATGKLTLKGTATHGVNLSGLTYPLQPDFDQGLFIDTLPSPLVQDKPYQLSQQNIDTVTVKDSSVSPKTISDAYYEIDPIYGTLTITDRASIMAVSGLTLPLKVSGIQGVTTQMGLMSENSIERQIVLNGINARDNRKVKIILYKVSFTPTAVDFFDKDYTKTPLEAEILSDPSKAGEDRKSTRLNSSHIPLSRMPSSA